MRLNLFGRDITLFVICRAPDGNIHRYEIYSIKYFNFNNMNAILKSAIRHLSNAKEILVEKAILENGKYHDKKYVKMARHTAYCGVLKL